MRKAVAIAITQPQNPFKAALISAENFVILATDMLYGTPKRIQCTMAFTIGLFTLSLALGMVSKTILQTCPI